MCREQPVDVVQRIGRRRRRALRAHLPLRATGAPSSRKTGHDEQSEPMSNSAGCEQRDVTTPERAMSAAEDDEQDLTREQQRERAHAEPKAGQRAEVNRAVRRAWLERLGIVAGLIVLIVIASGCSSKLGAPKQSRAQTQANGAERGTDAEVAALLAGIPQRGNTLGDPNAPVTVQFFGDLQCPYCRRFTLEVLPSLIQSYVRPGKLWNDLCSRRSWLLYVPHAIGTISDEAHQHLQSTRLRSL